ncbi:MAG: thioredoxin domain-containing protein [Alphaproteobacteria bacterium]
MSSSDKQEQSAKKSPVGLILILFVILGAALVIGLYNNAQAPKITQDQDAQAVAETSSSQDQKDEATNIETVAVTEENENDTSETSALNDDFDLVALSTPRILGNPDAPVEISEHSSFTCGACSAFHQGNFKLIKRDFIDTGKAYIVFDDFPRNKFDIEVGALARCVPEQSYFNFIQLMFETQPNWIQSLKQHKEQEFRTYIKQNAMLAGAKNAQKCLDSNELHEALAARQKLATKEHDINSTPTLVINNTTVLSGLSPYDQIKNAIEAELQKAPQ